MSTSRAELPLTAMELFHGMKDRPELLVAIGNSGRADDGLGWAFLDAFKSFNAGSRIEYRYQLNIEDAEMIAQYDSVIFIDASTNEEVKDYRISEVLPIASSSFTSHALEPEAVVHLAEQLYGSRPSAFLLELKGTEWGLREGLSFRARAHMDTALLDFTTWYLSV